MTAHEMKLKIYGYNNDKIEVQEQQGYARSTELLSSIKILNVNINNNLRKINQLVLLRKSRALFNQLFPNVNDEVIYINDDIFSLRSREISKKNVKSTEVTDFLNLYNELGEKISIFDIPIVTTTESSYVSLIFKSVVFIKNNKYLNNVPITFSYIELGKLTNISPITYLHEIAHGLLEQQKGAVANYLNSEILSIFLEKVVALEMDKKFLDFITAVRLRYVAGCLEDIITTKERIDYVNSNVLSYGQKKPREYPEVTKFITDNTKEVYSALKAEVLFQKYLDFDLDGKNVMISDISEIFSGNISLEEYITKYESNFNSKGFQYALNKRVNTVTKRM